MLVFSSRYYLSLQHDIIAYSAVLLHYEPTPGLLNQTHIYSGGLQTGWGVNSSSAITFQQITGVGVGGEPAVCANLPAFQVRRNTMYLQMQTTKWQWSDA